MPRPRPPHLHLEHTFRGKRVWYVRVGHGPRVRIRAEFGTPEFDAEYQAALSETPRPKKGHPASGTLSWLIERYRETPAWTAFSLATRRQRENILRQVIDSAGHKPFLAITEAMIAAGRDRRAGEQDREADRCGVQPYVRAPGQRYRQVLGVECGRSTRARGHRAARRRAGRDG